jgi:hypothetical protein
MPIAQLNGIGKSKIEVFLPARTSPFFEYTFPLTEKGGFTFQYEEDSFKHVLQNLDSSAPSKELVKFINGYWTKFMLSWENFPLPLSAAQAIIRTLNAQGRGRVVNSFKFTPKISLPDLFWYVLPVLPNNTLQLLNSDSPYDIGNYGMVIGFETIKTDPFIITVNPNDIQYPGSLDLPHIGPQET